MAATLTDWVLWGSHPRYATGVPLKLEIGSLRDCRSEKRYRERDNGWALTIRPKNEPAPILLDGVLCAVTTSVEEKSA